MIPTYNVWNRANNLKFLERNIEIKLTALRKSDWFKECLTKNTSHRVVIAPKNSEESKNFRELGNWQYLKCDDPDYINLIIDSYTRSIAHAPLGSTELSLAYTNRSALLMKIRLYDDALVDIRRALKAGYPDHLKAKLFLRRALCLMAVDPTAKSDIEKALENARGWLKRMDKKSQSRRIVTNTLSDLNKMAVLPPPRTKWNAKRFLNGVFEENPEIIDASSSIAIEPMENNKLGIVATRDIKPGEIISAQEPYVALLHADRTYTYCWHCRNYTLSAIPCNFCVHSVFCSETCRDTAWSEYHSIECQILATMAIFSSNVAHRIVAIRMMIRAVREAGSVQGLKEIIQRMESDPDSKWKGFTGSKFDGSKLSSIYGLLTHDNLISHDFTTLYRQSLIDVRLLAIQSNFFGEKMTPERFYHHESVPFITVVLIRFFQISTATLQLGYDTMDSPTAMDHSVMIVPLHSYIAHSPAPNVSRCVFGSKAVIYAHYPIKQGEQIFQSTRLEYKKDLKKDRQAEIILSFDGGSLCVACTKDWPNTDSLQNKVSGDILFVHKALLETIDERLDLTIPGHFILIAKLINDLSVTISDSWDRERPSSPELTQAVTLLNRIFFVLGNGRKFF